MTSGMSRIAAWHDQSLINLSEVKSSDTVTKNRPVTPHPQKESVKMSNVVNKQSSQQLSANVFSTTSHQQSKKSSSVETTVIRYD